MRTFIYISIRAKQTGDASEQECEVALIPFTLDQSERFAENAYKLIGTDNVDVKAVSIAGVPVDVWHDDDFNPQQLDRQFGLAFENAAGEFTPIFGSVILAGCADDGATVSCPVDTSVLSHCISSGTIKFVVAKQVNPEISVVSASQTMTSQVQEKTQEPVLASSSNVFYAPPCNTIQ